MIGFSKCFSFFLCDFLGCSMHSAPFRTEYFMQIKKKRKKKKARCWIMNLHDRQLDSQPRRGKCVILCPRSVNIPAALLLNVQTRDWVWKCACVFKENSLSGELDGQEIESPLSPMFSLRLSSSGSNFGLKRRRKRGKKIRNTPKWWEGKKLTYINPVMKRWEAAWTQWYHNIIIVLGTWVQWCCITCK